MRQRAPLTFFASPKKVSKERRPRGAEDSLSRVCLAAGLINSLRSDNQALASAKLPRVPEIAASFAKIRRWLALPYYAYCQRLAALSFGKAEPL